GISNACVFTAVQSACESVNHNLASTTKRFPGLPDVAASDAIEHNIDSSIREAPDLFDEIGISIIDRNASEASNDFEAVLRGSGIHFQPRNPAKFQQGGTDAAAATVDQHSLTRSSVSTSMHHLVSRHVIKDETERRERI